MMMTLQHWTESDDSDDSHGDEAWKTLGFAAVASLDPYVLLMSSICRGQNLTASCHGDFQCNIWECKSTSIGQTVITSNVSGLDALLLHAFGIQTLSAWLYICCNAIHVNCCTWSLATLDADAASSTAEYSSGNVELRGWTHKLSAKWLHVIHA